MRAAFTTEFIYDGVEGYLERKAKMCQILDAEMDLQGGNMIGRIAGITKGLDLAEEDIRRWLLEMCWELARVTKVQFKIVWLLEGGDVLIKEIHPVEGEKGKE